MKNRLEQQRQLTLAREQYVQNPQMVINSIFFRQNIDLYSIINMIIFR
jgi:hypothetical protein